MKKGIYRCLFCRKTFTEKDLLKRGVIKSRSKSRGGPYFIYKCAHCREEMKCLRGDRGWILEAPHEEWGIFEFFRRVLEGSLPLLGIEEGKGARVFGSSRASSTRGSPPRGGDSRKGEKKEEKDAKKRTVPPTGRVPEQWRTFYKILEVDHSASREDVVRAFRSLSKKVHPDRFINCDKEFQRLAHQKFIELKKAYDTLLRERFS